MKQVTIVDHVPAVVREREAGRAGVAHDPCLGGAHTGTSYSCPLQCWYRENRYSKYFLNHIFIHFLIRYILHSGHCNPEV